jgi:hypothetical protein
MVRLIAGGGVAGSQRDFIGKAGDLSAILILPMGRAIGCAERREAHRSRSMRFVPQRILWLYVPSDFAAT